MTLIISIVNGDKNEGTSSGSSDMKGEPHGLSLIHNSNRKLRFWKKSGGLSVSGRNPAQRCWYSIFEVLLTWDTPWGDDAGEELDNDGQVNVILCHLPKITGDILLFCRFFE